MLATRELNPSNTCKVPQLSLAVLFFICSYGLEVNPAIIHALEHTDSYTLKNNYSGH